jgi:UDP-N-acetylmuramate dehydrogenase
MRVGGPADLFVVAHNRMELRALVKFARARSIAHLILGRGSDVVISDRGIRGLVIQDRAEATRLDGSRYIADAGVPMARAATETQKAGLTGLEFGLAIPGTVGGAVWANAGAHESDVAAVLESADVLLADGREERMAVGDLGFAYRHSRLKDAPGEWVLGATFRLEPADAALIKTRLDDIRRWRQANQPLGLPSAGSVFRNPEGDSAGRLIDALGLKGRRIGGAVVSEKHANFIVNDQRGTAADVRRLGDEVRDAVEAAHGVRLRYEIEFLGDWDGWPWPAEDPP